MSGSSERRVLTRFELAPAQLTVLTTSTCNARCAHCCVSAGPERDDVLDASAIVQAVQDIHARYPLQVVVLAGGEPTLLGEDLLDVIAEIDCLGIVTRLVTNASWASTQRLARDMVSSLREAGLAELNLSADDFHLPFIPLANVVNAWRASKGSGFSAVVIALCSGPGSTLTPERMMTALGERPQLIYDGTGTRQAVTPAEDGTTYVIANTNVYRIGRGRKLRAALASFPNSLDELDQPCPFAIRSAALSPRGHLVACCGIEAEGNEVLDFGKLDGGVSVDDLIARAKADPVLAAIAELGPVHVMRRAMELDATLGFRPQHSAICEVCEVVVTNRRAVELLRRAPHLRVDLAAARAVRLVISATGFDVRESVLGP